MILQPQSDLIRENFCLGTKTFFRWCDFYRKAEREKSILADKVQRVLRLQRVATMTLARIPAWLGMAMETYRVCVLLGAVSAYRLEDTGD